MDKTRNKDSRSNVFKLGFASILILSSNVVSAAAIPNTDQTFLQVYVNNVENLTGTAVDVCQADYTDLIAYIKTQPYLPDVFLVQQINGAGNAQGDADWYETVLSNELGANYDHVIADASPGEFTSSNECTDAGLKKYQTNAIYYRTDRLKLVQGSLGTWRSNNTNCGENQNDRVKNVRAQFEDLIAGKLVSIGSLHWPKNANSACNISTVSTEMNSYPTSELIIFGGDLNDDDLDIDSNNWLSWYVEANTALSTTYGYSDPIYSLCSSLNSGEEAIKNCSHENLTLDVSRDTTEGGTGKKRRIDFLFARATDSFEPITSSDQHTITPAEADAVGNSNGIGYSDHRAVRARLHYPQTTNESPVIVENTKGPASIRLGKAKKYKQGAQAFQYGKVGDPSYNISEVTIYLSTQSNKPNGKLVFSIGTGVNDGTLENSALDIQPDDVPVTTPTGKGSRFEPFVINFPAPVGPLTAGTHYYLNFDASAVTNNKSYYLSISGDGNPYADGNYFRTGKSLRQRDARFKIVGTTQ